MVAITRIEAWALRCPVARPVATSFGVMRDRPAVFLRIEDGDGAFGWGEVFANWPAAGAEHRVNLLVDDVADLVLGADPSEPAALFDRLTAATRIRALQCGEPGPFAQVIAGLDIAAWDLAARRADVPLRTLLDPRAPNRVPAYASGLHIDHAAVEIDRLRGAGCTRFKAKVGFDPASDRAGLRVALVALGPGDSLALDANQAWGRAEAEAFLAACAGLPLAWMEEPIPADAPSADWAALAEASAIPLAGGENLAGEAAFDAALAVGALAVLQPDVAKWGGITGCHRVARAVRAAGRRYCPHYLGGGLGLAASAHLLAATGGDGVLEVDANPNPLRDAFGPVAGGWSGSDWAMPSEIGLGIAALPDELHRFVTHHRMARP